MIRVFAPVELPWSLKEGIHEVGIIDSVKPVISALPESKEVIAIDPRYFARQKDLLLVIQQNQKQYWDGNLSMMLTPLPRW
jgi:hypothetical protein